MIHRRYRPCILRPSRAPMKATILHTEASRGFGGQEVRILAEARWLLDHGWGALIAARPASRLLAEATAADIPARAVGMSHATSLRGLLSLRRLIGQICAAVIHTHS